MLFRSFVARNTSLLLWSIVTVRRPRRSSSSIILVHCPRPSSSSIVVVHRPRPPSSSIDLIHLRHPSPLTVEPWASTTPALTDNTRLGHSRVYLNGCSSTLEESSGASGRSWSVHWCIAVKVRTVVHKGGEEEYVVMQVQPHPSIVITRL